MLEDNELIERLEEYAYAPERELVDDCDKEMIIHINRMIIKHETALQDYKKRLELYNKKATS